MVSFNDRNFFVASIPTHRRDVHLKKYLPPPLPNITRYLTIVIGCLPKGTELVSFVRWKQPH